jgi:hypothetical protein
MTRKLGNRLSSVIDLYRDRDGTSDMPRDKSGLIPHLRSAACSYLAGCQNYGLLFVVSSVGNDGKV